MANLFLTISAILWTNYSQLIEIPFFHPIAPLYVYTSTDSSSPPIFPCSIENHWTFFFDDEMNCSNILNFDPDHDSKLYPHLILGIHRTDEYFFIPQTQSICMNILGDNLALHIGRISKANQINCYPYINLNYPLQLDSFLLMDWKSLIPAVTAIDLSSNWHIMCASLEYSFFQLSQTIPTHHRSYMTIISSLNYNLDSFIFWLEFCNLESMITRIHQQSKLTDISECLVNRVEGLPEDYQYDHTTSIICIEDIFPYLSSSSSSGGAAAVETAHFISPIGLDTLFLSNSNSSLLQNHLLDLNSMILAIQNLKRSSSSSFSLVMTSALKGFVKYLTEGTLPNLINEIFIHLSTATNLFQWQQSFSYFTFHMKDWFGTWAGETPAPPLPPRYHGEGSRAQKNVPLLELIHRYLFIQYFDELLGREAMIQQPQEQEHQEEVMIISSDSFSRYLLGDTLNRYISYLTLDSPSLPPSPPSLASLPSPSHRYLYHLGQYFMNPQHHHHQYQNQDQKEEQQEGKRKKNQEFVCQSHQILSYEVSNYSVVSTTTHVIIFVPPAELTQARNLLQKWRSECQYCVLVTQYLIFVIPNTSSLDVMSSSSPSSSSQHSYRQILLTLHDYLIHLVVDPDLVTVLIGFNSMKSFLQPGDHQGLLPIPLIGGVSYVRLFSSLVFASQTYHPPPPAHPAPPPAASSPKSNSVSCSEINFNAFVGTSNQILHFLNSVLHPPSSSHSSSGSASVRGCSDSSLRFLTLQYVQSHKDSHDIRIDSHFQFFDFRMIRVDEELVTPKPELLKLIGSDFISTIQRAHETILSTSNFEVIALSTPPPLPLSTSLL
jgi:hypothetical protein